MKNKMNRFLSFSLALVMSLTGLAYSSKQSKETVDSDSVYEIEVTDELSDEKIVIPEDDIPKVEKPEEKQDIPVEVEEEIIEDDIKTIKISAVGDCTLGRDHAYTYPNSLPYVLEINDNDYSYFFRNVYDILSNDDLTIANLEGALTNATIRADKKFAFKGDKDYTNILLEGSIEAVNLANNHTMDYLDVGYQDTLEALDDANIPYFGNGIYNIIQCQGIKIGLAGIKGWSEEQAKKDIDLAKEYFDNENVDLIIYSFHWGVEREYKQNSTQENIARYAIDMGGANLVLGHHPHVLQGIEKYNGVYIVYSLANFVFGGNKNPDDKYTMILRMDYTFRNGILEDSKITIIPALVSSITTANNYQPTIAEGDDKELILKRILENSTNFE